MLLLLVGVESHFPKELNSSDDNFVIMGLEDNITTSDDLWAFISSCFSTSNYRAHGFYHWGYRPGSSGGQVKQLALELTNATVWGHFSALMAWYKLNQSNPNWTKDPQWLYNWATEQQTMYYRMDNINTRRYKNDTSFSFYDFFGWLKSLCADATQEVYDWYPINRPSGFKAKLGPSRTFPGLLVIDAKGNAPNQFKPKGPLLQYTYNAGTKNAITNAILIASPTTVVKDYAQYKATPGWRGHPYDLNKMWSQGSAKIPYQDWIDELESNNRSRNWMMYSDAKSPIFSKLKSTPIKTTITTTIPTINYDYRYYDFLN